MRRPNAWTITLILLAMTLTMKAAERPRRWGGSQPHRAKAWKCNCGQCRLQRAGNPQGISRLARTSNTPRYWGYYVGGGAPFGGSQRMRNQGVWGWDFFGGVFNRRVSLNWWHGSKQQGGRGAYKADGPKVFHHE